MKTFPLERYKRYVILLIFFLYFIPRVIGLGNDMTNIDSQYWYPRIDRFTKNLIKGDFKGTYQQYHPGTTLMWLSGTSSFLFEKAFVMKYQFSPNKYPQQFPKWDFASRLPLILIISILGVITYQYLKKIVDERYAIIFSILLSLEPFFLGISRYLHLTALSTMFGFVSFLSLFFYSKKYGSNKHLLIAGIMLGLAIATKISLLIIMPALISILLPTKLEIKHIKKFFASTFFLVIISFITFVIVSPYMWIAPIWGIMKIYKEGVVDTGFGGGVPDAIFDNKYTFYLETAFLRTSSISIIFFVVGIYLFFKNYKTNTQPNRFLLLSLILFITYYLGLTIPSKLKDRYYVELMPSLLLFSAYGIYYVSKYFQKWEKSLIFSIYIILQVTYFYSYFPSSSFYYTELIGGPAGYHKMGLRPTNRGEWYADAAFFLNKYDSKPENQNVVIGNESLVNTFSKFFYGTTYAEFGAVPDKKGVKVKYIITRNENSRFVPKEVCKQIEAYGSRVPYKFDNVFVYECPTILKEDLSKLIPTFPDY